MEHSDKIQPFGPTAEDSAKAVGKPLISYLEVGNIVEDDNGAFEADPL